MAGNAPGGGGGNMRPVVRGAGGGGRPTIPGGAPVGNAPGGGGVREKPVGYGLKGNPFYNEANYEQSKAFAQRQRTGAGSGGNVPLGQGNRLSGVNPTLPHPGAPNLEPGSVDDHVEGLRPQIVGQGY